MSVNASQREVAAFFVYSDADTTDIELVFPVDPTVLVAGIFGVRSGLMMMSPTRLITRQSPERMLAAWLGVKKDNTPKANDSLGENDSPNNAKVKDGVLITGVEVDAPLSPILFNGCVFFYHTLFFSNSFFDMSMLQQIFRPNLDPKTRAPTIKTYQRPLHCPDP